MRRGHRPTGMREPARVRHTPSRVTMIAVVIGACMLQACASAPPNLGSQAEEPPAIAAQETLRTAAATLVATARQEGWRLEDEREGGAFALLGRLVTGAEPAPEDGAGAGEPVEVYLMRHDNAPAAALLADITLADALARDVIDAGRAVAGSEADLTQETIDRDIAGIESALIAARRARAFFSAVENELARRGALRRELQVSTALIRLDARIETLAATADALAARRWGNLHSTMS